MKWSFTVLRKEMRVYGVGCYCSEQVMRRTEYRKGLVQGREMKG